MSAIRRTVNPGKPLDDGQARRLGATLPREQRDRDRQRSENRAPSLLSVAREFWFFREDIGSAGDASYTTRTIIPSGASAFASVNGIGYRAPRDGMIVEAYLQLSAARSGGTATVAVRITNGVGSTDYPLTDCTIDATTTQTVSGYTRVQAGIPVAAGETIDARIVTAGTFAPTTADALLILVFVTVEELD